MANYTSRHLIAAHAVVLRLQQNPRTQIEQVDAKDIIAEALADAERGVFVASQSRAGNPGDAEYPKGHGEYCDCGDCIAVSNWNG